MLKYLALILILLSSSTAYAEWKLVSVSVNLGDHYYVDFDRIRKADGYVYFWVLRDYVKPDKWGDLSWQTYYQGDCKLFRIKGLSVFYYKEPMGEGISEADNSPNEWAYPPPKSSGEIILKSVCEHAN